MYFSTLTNSFKTALYFISWGILFALSLPSNSANQLQTKNQQTIQVKTEVWKPYQYLDENNQPAGYAIDVLNALLENLELKPDIAFSPWLRAYKKAQESKNTIILTTARTSEREKNFHWIALLKSESFSFYALKSNTKIGSVDSLNDLMSFSVAVNKDSVLDKYVTKMNFPHIERTFDLGEAYKLFYKGRADLLLKSASGVKTETETFGYSFNKIRKVLDVPVLSTQLYIALNINSDPELVDSLNREYARLVSEGTIEQLKIKWNLE